MIAWLYSRVAVQQHGGTAENPAPLLSREPGSLAVRTWLSVLELSVPGV